MEQVSFLSVLEAGEKASAPLTPWQLMEAGMQDYDLAEERARILNQGKNV